MPEIDIDRLKSYRDFTFRTSQERRLHSADDALSFVEERSFIFFWRISGVELPSLWCAVAGDRPVPNNHDDPAHITWDWKDSLLDKKRWYYSRLLRRKNTIISLEAAPYFYALSPNYGNFETDYLELYESGTMTMEARQVYEALLREGALDSLSLRRAARLASRESKSRFSRALDDLQVAMMVMPVGIARAGHWNYAFIYDIPARYMPELVEQSRFIDEDGVRKWLLRRYFCSLGAAARSDAARIFGWQTDLFSAALNELVENGELCACLMHNEKKGEWLSLPELLKQPLHEQLSTI